MSVKEENKDYEPHIALLIMCKNEEKRINITLESVKGVVDSIVVYDTGSTDNTVNLIKSFCAKNKLPCRLKEGEFKDFSTSRNISLDFADKFNDIDYVLLLDINDELRGGEELKKLAKQYYDKKESGFLLSQEWWSGKIDKYFNLRFLKTRNNWRYRGRVHEYLSQDGKTQGVVKVGDKIVLYQDRIADNNKSGPRFVRDKKLLLEDYEEDPTEPRTVFYLAQTCGCLQQWDEALKYYDIRSNLEGFQEEVFHSYLRAGEMSETLKKPWYESMTWYIKAFEHSKRVEPVLNIAKYYEREKDWLMSFIFCDIACKLSYPTNSILFVNRQAYDFDRWRHMGIVGWYAGKLEEGFKGCRIAIENGDKMGMDTSIDKNNFNYYLKKFKENETTPPSTNPPVPTPDNSVNVEDSTNTVDNKQMTKKQFIAKYTPIIKSENKNMSNKKIAAKIKELWKEHRKTC